LRISVLGCGYVGAVTGVCFAELGHEVFFVDVDPAKVEAINSAISPIFEPGLDKLLAKNNAVISATTDIHQAIQETEITFVCVGTPSNSNGSIDLTYVQSACQNIGQVLKQKDEMHIVVVKSTVLPGTTEGMVRQSLEEASGKVAHVDFGLASNPEFLREGSALADFISPDRIIIGTADDYAHQTLGELYSSFDCPKLCTTIPVAEMIKYVSNAFLATKISFANEIGNICKKMGIDTAEVFTGVGMDHRINPAFFQSGIGFGGSCFPKDVRALIAKAEELDVDARILKDVSRVNEDQPLKMLDLLERHVPDLENKKIGLLGLAFKPNTDDVRDSRATPLVKELLRKGATVLAYDPMAMGNFKRLYPQIEYAPSADSVLEADAILIATEWEDFENLNYQNKIVIDGRRIKKAREGSTYEGVCW